MFLGPQYKTIDTFSGILKDSKSVATQSVNAVYGSSDVRVIINFEKGNNDINRLNVTYCLQRKILVFIHLTRFFSIFT